MVAPLIPAATALVSRLAMSRLGTVLATQLSRGGGKYLPLWAARGAAQAGGWLAVMEVMKKPKKRKAKKRKSKKRKSKKKR